MIDQASCNLDASCVKGDCPAFVTVKPAKAHGAGRARISAEAAGELPEPELRRAGGRRHDPHAGHRRHRASSPSARCSAAAAKIDGLDAHAVDQTGLSQKAGPVVSTTSIGDAAARA